MHNVNNRISALASNILTQYVMILLKYLRFCELCVCVSASFIILLFLGSLHQLLVFYDVIVCIYLINFIS